MPKLDDRTEKNIQTLLPAAQEQAREFLSRLVATGINARIISGTRTYAEQDALYAQGRTKPGSIVTNAKGGYSNHNFGIAWDIGIFNGTNYVPESPLYDKAGPIGREMGLEWGGDWKTIKDKPHYQCKTGKTTAQLREIVANGSPIPIQPLSGQPAGQTTETPVEIKIHVDGNTAHIPALLIEDRTWVGVRAFVTVLGGSLDAAGGNPFHATVSLSGSSKECEGRIIGDTGFVKFTDLNGLYKLTFKYDGLVKTLSISK